MTVLKIKFTLSGNERPGRDIIPLLNTYFTLKLS